MVKEVNVVLMGVLMTLFLVISNGAYLIYQAEDPVNIISGNSVKEVISGFYAESSVNHRVFILSQFLLLFVIIIVFFIMVRKFKSKGKLSKGDFVGVRNIKSRTDLDTLYEILKRKKEININDIGKVFKVNLEVALEWSKILEDGDLAMIDYPRFGKPVLKLLEKDNMDECVPKENVKDKKKIESKKIEEKIKNSPHKDVVPVKKIIAPKNIPKKEVRGNLKIKKQIEKKVERKSKNK